MSGIELLRSVVADINGLNLQGIQNWNRAIMAVKKIEAVIDAMQKEEESKQKAREDALEEARQKRQKQLEEAAENGEEILGGETIRINADGSQEVLIP